MICKLNKNYPSKIELFIVNNYYVWFCRWLKSNEITEVEKEDPKMQAYKRKAQKIKVLYHERQTNVCLNTEKKKEAIVKKFQTSTLMLEHDASTPTMA